MLLVYILLRKNSSKFVDVTYVGGKCNEVIVRGNQCDHRHVVLDGGTMQLVFRRVSADDFPQRSDRL